MTRRKEATPRTGPLGALADEFPAIAQLYAATAPYTAATAAQVTALAADVHKAVDALVDVRGRLARQLAAQPFGPGYQAGYRRALEEHGPQLLACLDAQVTLADAARTLTALVAGFDPDEATGADLLALQNANETVTDLLPAVTVPIVVPPAAPRVEVSEPLPGVIPGDDTEVPL